MIISKIEINFANDMDEKTIKETLLKGERVTLECKKATAEVPKSIWLTFLFYSAFLAGRYVAFNDRCYPTEMTAG